MQLKRFSRTKFQDVKPRYYHLTARTKDDEYFDIPMARAWHECLDCLKKSHQNLKIDIISFVLMNNHYHLLIKCSESELLKFMYGFHPLGLTRIKREEITAKRYLYHAYRYVYQNPLRAGLVKRIEDYPYSLIYYLKQGKSFSFPISDRFGFNDEYKLHLLNQNTAHGFYA